MLEHMFEYSQSEGERNTFHPPDNQMRLADYLGELSAAGNRIVLNPEEHPGTVRAVPSRELLDCLLAVDLNQLDDYALVEVIADYERVLSWLHAQQLKTIYALNRRPAMAVANLTRQPRGRFSSVTADELAQRLAMSRPTAVRMVELAVAVNTECAATGDALAAGRLTRSQAAAIVTHLAAPDRDPDLVRTVESNVLEWADQRTPAQLRKDVATSLAAADPLGAEDRRREALRQRRVCHPRTLPDGMASMTMILAAPTAMRLDSALHTVAAAAKSSGDSRTTDQLRADTVADLTDQLADALATNGIVLRPDGTLAAGGTVSAGGTVAASGVNAGSRTVAASGDNSGCAGAAGVTASRILPPIIGVPPPDPGSGRAARGSRRTAVRVTVALSTLLGLDDAPGHLDGYGPVTAVVARAMARGGVWRRIVTDPLTGAVLDVGRTRYQAPADLGRLVRERDEVCARPGCSVRADHAEIDHITEWQNDGHTCDENLIPMCSHDHTLKTLGMFGVDRDRDGTITWTTPSGHRYRAVPEPVHRASIIAKALAYEPKETASEPPDPDLDRYFDTAVALGIIDPADFDDVPDPEVDAP
jgi:hypothetical protein